MAATLGELDLEDAAKEAAGNWRNFECFCWHRASELDDPDGWTVAYGHHRDSGLLAQSNAEAIGKAMQPFMNSEDPDVFSEHHSHWAGGWIDGYSIRVFRDGEVTDAFRAYHELAQRLADYRVLDEEDYSRRECEATLENIADAASRLKRRFDLPEGWEPDVYSWLANHNDRAIENSDDQGGYPEEAELEAAFLALGFERIASATNR
jgi:hypothetical protein